MAVAKTDWKRHAAIYAEKHAPNGVSIAEYAEQNGLNKNTARRYLRSGETARDQQRDQVGDHTGDHVVGQASDHDSAQPVKTAKARAGAASKEKASRSAGAAKGARKAKSEKAENGDHFDDHLLIPEARTRLKRPRVTVPVEVMRRVRGTGSKPNSHPVAHGGYAEAPDHLWDAALAIPDDEIDFWNVRGAMVSLMNIAANRKAVFDYYSEMDTTSGGDQPKAPKEVQLLKTACSGIDLEVMLRGFIQKQQQQDYQNEIRRAELEIKLAERQKKAVIEKQVLAILVRRDKEEMTASYACRLIERIGGVVPQTLLREFDHELRTPKVDDNASSNFKDFEADVEAYFAEQRAAEGYVTQRREEVMQLVDKMGMGDDATDNASMLSIAFQDDDDDGEEWESEEESTLYAPDFGVDDDIDDDDDEDDE